MISTIRFALRSAMIAGLCLQIGSVANAQSIGDSMTAYLNDQLGSRVGGGRSSHMASEALRVGGGEFVPADLGNDYPSEGDKVWGTLVTVISCTNNIWTNSNPTNACQPGDVIQFGSAAFGSTTYPEHFTGVVATTDSGGRPSAVYQQNFAGNRVVKQVTLDTTSLTSGWLRIYRPIARIDRFNEWKFTVVNNSASSRSYQLMDGVYVDSVNTLTATNTSGSYLIHVVTTIGTVPNYFLLDNQSSYFVETAKGNEIFDSSNGLAIRQLSQ